MSDFVVSRLGQTNQSGDANALFLKKFAGEVLTAFYTKNRSMDKHTVRTITNGKSAAFPFTGTGTAARHTPGVELVGTKIGHAEKEIFVDDELVADRFIANIDDLKNHFDARSVYTKDMGEVISRQFDRQILNLGVLSARASHPVTGEPGGSSVGTANIKTVAADLRNAIYDGVEALAANDVDLDDLVCFLRPAQFYLLIDDSKLVNKDYSTNNGGVDTGTIIQAAGVPLIMTNNLPITDLSADGDFLSKYQVNASTVAGLIMGKDAVATVKLMDLSMESEYSARHRGTLMVAGLAVGSDVLRPTSACELKTDA